MQKGIDVSGYQGTIDWKKVKRDGVQFSILKVIRKDLNPDKQFENNWAGCTDASMPIHGVYNYSYATSVSKAKTDAQKVLKILNGRKPRVYLDVEDACQKNLGRLLIDIINAYAEVIMGAGLEFGVYTGLSFYNTYIKPYGGVKYPLWIARYCPLFDDGSINEAYKPSVDGMVGWQYTSKGKVAGISGNVDMNVWYEEMETVKPVSGKTASKVLEQARAWLGKNEADGSHKEIIDIYNAHLPLARGYKVKYTDLWCATFVSSVAIKLGYTDIIPTECGCEKMIESYKAIGRWIENENRTPKPGDIIFYDWQDKEDYENTDCVGWSDHVGIVESVSDGIITLIEGNYDDAVKRRNLAVNGRYIRGYGVPDYDMHTNAISPTKSVEEIAKEVIAGKWGTGADRKKKLASAGYDYATIQAKVNEMLTSYYPKYTGTSKQVDVVFKAIGVPAKFIGNRMKRKLIAEANGITGYTGKAAQNLSLIALAKQGKLKKV